MIKRFFVYGITGWSMEIIWTGLHSFLTAIWSCRIYKYLDALYLWFCSFSGTIHDIIKQWRWQIRGLIWVVIIWGIEYTSGLVLTNILGTAPWFYTGPFAVDNLVRLDYAPAWFVAGLIFERIHEALDIYKIA